MYVPYSTAQRSNSESSVYQTVRGAEKLAVVVFEGSYYGARNGEGWDAHRRCYLHVGEVEVRYRIGCRCCMFDQCHKWKLAVVV